MAITLTEAAARHVSRYLARRGQGLGVRLGVRTSGCSGLAYTLEYVDQAAAQAALDQLYLEQSSAQQALAETEQEAEKLETLLARISADISALFQS